MDQARLRDIILDAARTCYDQGPGWAQEGVVLREIAERHREIRDDLERQQEVLTCWHKLFNEGKLSWGYNLDTPNAPWFHFPREAS